ncbi:MAG: choice-of-anchor M domain-containing protein [Opitutales bacterium]
MQAWTCLCLGFLAVSVASAQPLDLLLGHFEVHIDYTAGSEDPDEGWEFSISYDEDSDFVDREGLTRLDPANTRLIATPPTQETATSELRNAGFPSGALWRLPRNRKDGALWLGLRTIADPGIFQTSVGGTFFAFDGSPGNIALELESVTGSGPDAGGEFAMWTNSSFGTPQVHFATFSAPGVTNRLEPVPIAQHEHYNWGMTRPGEYCVTLRALSKLMPSQGGTLTDSEATFHFVVPYPADLGSEVTVAPGIARDREPALIWGESGVAFTVERAGVTAGTISEGGQSYVHAVRLKPTAGPAPASERVGYSAERANGLPPELTRPVLRVAEIVGPGNVDIIAETAEVTFLAFDEAGIYRVQISPSAEDIEDGALIEGEPFALTVLVGMGFDYGYEAWAGSFERTHGLVEDHLSDPMADGDNDGVPNGVEYQLFWHGFDPGVRDAWRLPRPEQDSNGQWELAYLRDTYKDDFATALELSAFLGTELGTFQKGTAREEGNPLQLNELGADQGNALGRVMRRKLVLPVTGAEISFVRFGLE